MSAESLINPDLQFSIVCDSIRREDNGKLMFIGIFEVIGAKKFPARHHQLFIANRWIKGSGTFTEKTRIVSLKDNKVLVETKEVTFELKTMEASHTVISKFVNVMFPEPGKYQVEVLLNGNILRFYPIILAQPPAGKA
ncbi:MAG: hypothetical protein ABH848_05705 [Candidatus Omnitrophota bacterium]